MRQRVDRAARTKECTFLTSTIEIRFPITTRLHSVREDRDVASRRGIRFNVRCVIRSFAHSLADRNIRVISDLTDDGLRTNESAGTHLITDNRKARRRMVACVDSQKKKHRVVLAG